MCHLLLKSLVIINVILDSVKRPPLELEPHFGAHCLHRQLRDLTDTEAENINRMSPLLSGMFPLRIYACHQMCRDEPAARRTTWYGRFPIISSLMGRFLDGGEVDVGEVESRTTLRKKQPCSQGKDSPLAPASLLLSVPDCLVWLVSRMRYIRIHEKRKFNTKSIYPIQMEKSIDEWPAVPFRVSKCLKKNTERAR